MIRDVDPGSRIRILIFTHPGSRVKKELDPGSATMFPRRFPVYFMTTGGFLYVFSLSISSLQSI
jgi:hypothetical protein